MNLIPLQDRIILKKITEEQEPRKGILISLNSAPKQDRYEIIEIGDEALNKCNLDPRHVVYVEKYKGQIILQDGVEYLTVKVEDIIAYERG